MDTFSATYALWHNVPNIRRREQKEAAEWRLAIYRPANSVPCRGHPVALVHQGWDGPQWGPR